MSLISPERQYAINYEISREAPKPVTPPATSRREKDTGTAEAAGILLDDPVTLQGQAAAVASKPRVPLQEFHASVGRDSAFIEATLRNKLAEYGLRPNTRVELSRDDLGALRVSANAPQALLSQISQDLNSSQEFRAAFTRLSQNQPTLDYVANVNKLSSAYGSGNNLFNSLVSSHDDNNSLTDIASRYDRLRQTVATGQVPTTLQTQASNDYRFTLNG